MRQTLVISMLSALASLAVADTLHLRNGTAVDGDVVRSSSEAMLVRVGTQFRSIPIVEIDSVIFGKTPGQAGRDPAPPPPTARFAARQEAEGFVVLLKNCVARTTAAVLCSYSIENKKADRQIALQSSYMVGSDGLQQTPVKGHLGNSNAPAPAVYNTPVHGEIQFGGVTPNVDRIAKLSLHFGAFGPNGNVNFEIVYRNVPLPMTGIDAADGK